jgi:uncharacterized protein YktB (UPF0637 family)
MSSSVFSATPVSPVAWHALYHAALFESDRDKIPQRIAEAENAILSRITELFAVATDHIEEDIVLDDALYALRALRTCVLPEATAA